MARFCGAIDERTQDFEGSAVAYLVDAFGISIGALFGTPPVTAFIESGAGISEGGATGLTAMTTGMCFFISIFFAPIFASIPPYATGCVLIIVGSLMAKSAADINWRYIGDSIPAFLTIAIMPFTYSIAYGLIAGIISYMIINTTVWLIEISTGGRIKPPDKEYKDPWTYKLEGGILPPWVVRAAKGKKDFWRPYDDLEHNPAPTAGSATTDVNPGMAKTMATATGTATAFGPASTTLEGVEYPAAATTSPGAGAGGSGSGSTSEDGEKGKM
jgi:AGZA family xanthine/uracil permease-like MFS transporter